MKINMIIIFSIIFIISRIILVLIGRKTINHDSYLYLLRSRQIRNKLFKKKNIEIFEDKPYATPPLFPFLFSFFPEKWREKIFKITPIFLDLINFLIFYTFIYVININNKYLNYLFLLFIFYPLYTSLYPGPRTYKTSPRLLSELFVNLIFLFLFLFLNSNNLIYLLLAYLFGIFALLTNKFGLQVILFFIIPLGILIRSWILITYPFVIILLTIIFSNKLYYFILMAHLNHLKIYFKSIQFHHPFILARKKNKITILKEKGFKKFLSSILLESDFFNFFVKNYLVLIVGFLLIFKGNTISNFFLFWFIIAILIYLFTTIKYFRFLGEPERYLFYSGLALFILFAQYELPFIIYIILIIFEILYWFLMILAICLREYDAAKKLREKNEKEIIDFLKKKDYKKILPIQYNSPWKIMYLSGKRFFGFFDIKKNTPLYYYKIRLPINDLKKIEENYQIDALLLKKEFKKRFAQSLKNWRIVFENDLFEIYESCFFKKNEM